jgi:hypothetical protein
VVKTPSFQSTVEASTFQARAARSPICRRSSWAASIAARPVANVVRLLPLVPVYRGKDLKQFGFMKAAVAKIPADGLRDFFLIFHDERFYGHQCMAPLGQGKERIVQPSRPLPVENLTGRTRLDQGDCCNRLVHLRASAFFR